MAGKKLTTRSIRHTTAIHLLESGADMHVIKAWLGHRSTRSTDHYLDLDLRTQRELLSKLIMEVAIPDPNTIVIPPPNITGSLHMGRALDNTIQDVVGRRASPERSRSLQRVDGIRSGSDPLWTSSTRSSLSSSIDRNSTYFRGSDL